MTRRPYYRIVPPGEHLPGVDVWGEGGGPLLAYRTMEDMAAMRPGDIADLMAADPERQARGLAAMVGAAAPMSREAALALAVARDELIERGLIVEPK
jgi:hypothetical protein